MGIILGAIALLFFALISGGVTAAVTTTVVDLGRRGATQRFLYIHPDAPTAIIISLPGGSGRLDIQLDGTETGGDVAQCELLGRNRNAFTDRGYALAIVDAGTLYRTTGPAFNAVPFLPANVTVTPVGTVTISFANGNSATYAYTVTLTGQGAVTQTKTVTRKVFRAPGTVCR